MIDEIEIFLESKDLDYIHTGEEIKKIVEIEGKLYFIVLKQ